MGEINTSEELNRLKAQSNNYSNEVVSLNKKIDTLEEVYEGLNKRENDFVEMQSNKLGILEKIDNETCLPKFSVGLTEKIKGRLTGKEFYDAYDGLGTAKTKIRQEINRLYEEISTLNKKIYQCNMDIGSLKKELVDEQV